MKEKFANFNILLIHYLKRDWIKILFWVIGVGIFSSGFVSAFEKIGEGNGLVGMFETMKNPAMITLVGPTPIKDPFKYTVGAMYSHEMLLFSGLVSLIVSALHTISHTRKEEDLGLTEIIRSFKVGRLSNALAIIMETIFINIILTVFIYFVMVSFNVESVTKNGALLFSISIGLAGILGNAVAVLIGQIMPNASSSNGVTLGIIGILYIIRGYTDNKNINLSYLNPLSWIYLTFPFTKNNYNILIYIIIFSIFMYILAFVLESKRDMGSSYITEKEGKGYGKKSFLSVKGFLLKINKGTIIGWNFTFLLLGIAYGSIYGDMQLFIESNDFIKTMFTQSNTTLESSFTSVIMMVLILIVTILPIVIINRLFTEEKSSRLSQIYATKTSRTKLYWTNVFIALIFGVIGILISTISLGKTAIFVMDNKNIIEMKDFLLSGLNYISTIIFFIGLSSFIIGLIPKFNKFPYIYLIYTFIISYFKEILDLPKWFTNTAIYSWISQMPMENFNVKTFIIINLIGIILTVFGFVFYKKRDLYEGE